MIRIFSYIYQKPEIFLFYFSESIRHKATPTAYLLNIHVILILSL